MAQISRRMMIAGGALGAAALSLGAWRFSGGDAGATAETGARRILWPDLRPPVDVDALLAAEIEARRSGGTIQSPAGAIPAIGGGLVTASHDPAQFDPNRPGATQPGAAEWVDGRGIDTSPAADAPFAWDQEPARLEDLVAALDGQRIALPGYSVPLDLEADGTRVFLLAPYVGACIHVPPPPPNQIVLVTTETPYWFDTMFEALVVTGPMKVEPMQSRLAEVGYQIQAEAIRPFDPEGEGADWMEAATR